MSLPDFREVIRQAKELHVFQVALGGGNPNQHPDFAEMLRLCREDFGIVPNFTTNGRGLTVDVLEATQAYCGAVAVSAYAPFVETELAIEALKSRDIVTNVHFVLTSRSVDLAIEWLKNPPRFLTKADAIVFLNYKPVGRYADNDLLLNRSNRLSEFFASATTGEHPFKVGFDTCTVTGLARLGNAHAISLEGCDAGRFSLFVSEAMEVYPCSFMVEAGYKGISLRSKSLLEIWQGHPIFTAIRDRHRRGSCKNCTTPESCLAGCPLFPEMNLCARETPRDISEIHVPLKNLLQAKW
jgi:radical SAM protein with 4Fe4S-binding SPASM domain